MRVACVLGGSDVIEIWRLNPLLDCLVNQSWVGRIKRPGQERQERGAEAGSRASELGVDLDDLGDLVFADAGEPGLAVGGVAAGEVVKELAFGRVVETGIARRGADLVVEEIDIR